MKRKLALIADIKNWSFDIDAHFFKRALENEFEIDILFSNEDPINRDFLKLSQMVKDYDIIFFFWRKDLLPLLEEETRKKMIDNGINIENFTSKIVTEIFDHRFIGDSDMNNILNNYCKCYAVSSNVLNNIYTSTPNLKAPYCVLTDTFDESIFFPKNMQRFNKSNEETLVVGWVGNSKWYSKMQMDFKGYNTIYQPVCQELIEEGYNIKCFNADRNEKWIPNNEMSDYYSKIDIYICVSSEEGTPRPLLEAMGCGVPIIMTDVGLAKQCLGEMQQNYIIGSRENGKNDDKIRMTLKQKIIELYNDRPLLKKLSEENLKNSTKINFSAMAEKYRTFFMEVDKFIQQGIDM